MSLYKFDKQNDIIRNRIKSHPRTYFLLSNKKIHYNDQSLPFSDASVEAGGDETIQHTPRGYLSLHEININRDEQPGNENLLYPFITKQGALDSFKTVSTESFQGFSYGDVIKGEYPLSSSISTDYYPENSDRARLNSLKNTFNYYKSISKHYSFDQKQTQEIKLVSIPSIFFGSRIKKGSVKMNFYVTGSLAATIEDKNRNGEMIQTYSVSGTGDGEVAGTVLYNEGFVALTGSWDIHPTYKDIFLDDDAAPISPKWTLWGQDELEDVEAETFCPSASWDISFLGTTYTPVLTMFAHANEGHLNHSNNPTFTKKIFNDDTNVVSGSRIIENKKREIQNIVKSPYGNTLATFDKVTFISKVGIYDEHKNLIAIAKLATPVRKTETRSYTFKMKLDI